MNGPDRAWLLGTALPGGPHGSILWTMNGEAWRIDFQQEDMARGSEVRKIRV